MADTLTPSDQATACSPLEQEVLNEYALLLDNLNKVRPAPPRPSPSRRLRARPLTSATSQLSGVLSSLAERPTAEVLDGLRMLERKTSLVCTLLKASVYSIVLQQQIYGGEEGEGRG